MNPKTKLKNLKYEIPGEETPKHKRNLTLTLTITFVAMVSLTVLSILSADYIDNFAEADPDNGLAIVIAFLGVVLIVRQSLKKWLL